MTTHNRKQIADECAKATAWLDEFTEWPILSSADREWLDGIRELLWKVRVAALREEGGEPDVLSSADERTRVALDLPTNASKARVADSAEWLRAKYDRICGRLQECAQKYGLGLGGEEVDELVVAEVDRLRSQAAVPASDLPGLTADADEPLAGRTFVEAAVPAREVCCICGDPNCEAPNEAGFDDEVRASKGLPVDSEPSESDEFVESVYDLLCNYRTQTREDCRAVAHKIADLPERTTRIN